MIIASELFQGEIVIHMKEKIVLFILVCALTISLSSCKKKNSGQRMMQPAGPFQKVQAQPS